MIHSSVSYIKVVSIESDHLIHLAGNSCLLTGSHSLGSQLKGISVKRTKMVFEAGLQLYFICSP